MFSPCARTNFAALIAGQEIALGWSRLQCGIRFPEAVFAFVRVNFGFDFDVTFGGREFRTLLSYIMIGSLTRLAQ